MLQHNTVYPSPYASAKNVQPQSLPYQTLVDSNRLKLKTIEAQYFQNQYQNILSARQRQKELLKQEKQRDRQLIEAKKWAYEQEVQRKMQKKQMQRAYLSNDYKSTIDYHHQKHRNQKQLNKMIEKQVLVSPTWVRDTQTQRQANIRKKLYYSKLLEEQVRLQEQRKKSQKLSKGFYEDKIKRQADEILQKEISEMEAKHRQKSMFEQRQNQLLGIGTQEPNLGQSRSLFQKERMLKNTERQIYRQGLQAQYERQQNQKNQKRRAFSQQKTELNPRYNPITNPIPFVYKNPNVLRMLNNP